MDLIILEEALRQIDEGVTPPSQPGSHTRQVLAPCGCHLSQLLGPCDGIPGFYDDNGFAGPRAEWHVEHQFRNDRLCTNIHDPITLLRRELGRMRLVMNTERTLQDQVEQALGTLAIDYEREKRFDARNRPDFYLPAGQWALEVKRRCRAALIRDQLVRYLALDEIFGVVLIAPHEVDIPPLPIRKPIRFIPLWKMMVV